jgi:hypothetical protein
MHKLGDLKKFFFKDKKRTHLILYSILACRLPTGFWVPQMVMLYKLHTASAFFFSGIRYKAQQEKKKFAASRD